MIEELLDSFRGLYPGVTVVSEYVPADDLVGRFADQVSAGLGPDLLIGIRLGILRDLVDSGLLLDLSRYEFTDSTMREFMEFDLGMEELVPDAVDALRISSSLYGLPFACDTKVLYFNKNLVHNRITSLSKLLEAAQAGEVILLPIDYHHAYWGVRAFGGQVLDEEGNVALDQGLVAWLEWLLEAQLEARIILNSHYEDLRESFAQGTAAHFVGNTSDLSMLTERLGEEVLGVATLPMALQVDQNGKAASFLELQVLAGSRVSGEEEALLSLMAFLTNQTQQRKLALSGLGKIPVNRNVSFDSRLSPVPATLIRQSRDAVIVPLALVHKQEMVREIGDEIYLKVLEGELAPEEAASQLVEQVNLQLTKGE